MNRSFGVAALAAISLCLGSGKADASEIVRHETFKGRQAYASFGQYGETPCADGTTGQTSYYVFVLYDDYTQRDPDTKTDIDELSVLVSYTQYCSGTYTFGYGSAAIPNADVKLSDMQSARLRGSLAISDYWTGTPFATVALDLELDGTGEVLRIPSHQQYEAGPVSVVLESVGTMREALASGTVTVNGVELVSGFSGGGLSKTESGELIIQKP